jgi:signal transduction histidine kinase
VQLSWYDRESVALNLRRVGQEARTLLRLSELLEGALDDLDPDEVRAHLDLLERHLRRALDRVEHAKRTVEAYLPPALREESAAKR